MPSFWLYAKIMAKFDVAVVLNYELYLKSTISDHSYLAHRLLHSHIRAKKKEKKPFRSSANE